MINKKNKTIIIKGFVLFLLIPIIISTCSLKGDIDDLKDQSENENNAQKPGDNENPINNIEEGKQRLYKGDDFIGNYSLISALSYISNNAINEDEFTIVIYEDEVITNITLNYKKKIGITLKGYGEERKISYYGDSPMFYIYSGITLKLENLILTGRSRSNLGLISTYESGILIMNSNVKVIGDMSLGSGVSIRENSSDSGGIFIMNDGLISGFPIGVRVGNNGTFNMHNGTISMNTSNGVGNNGTFNMYNGTISMNTGRGVGNSGTFIMHNGTITDNTGVYGGGVLNNRSFIMHNGTITDNTGVYGGGVCNSGTFSIHNGTISENSAEFGGGVYNERSFSMYSGIISKNTAVTGGGVYNISFSSDFDLINGTISGNTATCTGGVFVDGKFTMRGGIISGNTSNGVRVSLLSVSQNMHFIKSNTESNNSGIIYGSEAEGYDANGIPYKNDIAVFSFKNPNLDWDDVYRKETVGETDRISTKTGYGLSFDGEPPYLNTW